MMETGSVEVEEGRCENVGVVNTKFDKRDANRALTFSKSSLVVEKEVRAAYGTFGIHHTTENL
jgi:hypothetical protein